MNRYRLCAVQIETGRNPEENRQKAFDLCRQAAGMEPDFIVLPEMFEIVVPPKKASQHEAVAEMEDTVFIQTSALTGLNIESAFLELTKRIISSRTFSVDFYENLWKNIKKD